MELFHTGWGTSQALPDPKCQRKSTSSRAWGSTTPGDAGESPNVHKHPPSVHFGSVVRAEALFHFGLWGRTFTPSSYQCWNKLLNCGRSTRAIEGKHSCRLVAATVNLITLSGKLSEGQKRWSVEMEHPFAAAATRLRLSQTRRWNSSLLSSLVSFWHTSHGWWDFTVV